MFYVAAVVCMVAATALACVSVIVVARSYNRSMKLSLEATEKMLEEERQNGDSDEGTAQEGRY